MFHCSDTTYCIEKIDSMHNAEVDMVMIPHINSLSSLQAFS